MKKRLIKKFESAEKLMNKPLSGKYAETIARRIDKYGYYDFLYCNKPKTNYNRRYVIVPCYNYSIVGDKEYEEETGFFVLNRFSDWLSDLLKEKRLSKVSEEEGETTSYVEETDYYFENYDFDNGFKS